MGLREFDEVIASMPPRIREFAVGFGDRGNAGREFADIVEDFFREFDTELPHSVYSRTGFTEYGAVERVERLFAYAAFGGT